MVSLSGQEIVEVTFSKLKGTGMKDQMIFTTQQRDIDLRQND